MLECIKHHIILCSDSYLYWWLAYIHEGISDLCIYVAVTSSYPRDRDVTALLLHFILVSLKYLVSVWCPYLLSSFWILCRCTRLHYQTSRLSPFVRLIFYQSFSLFELLKYFRFLLQKVYPNFSWKIIYESNGTSNGCYSRKPPHICVYKI